MPHPIKKQYTTVEAQKILGYKQRLAVYDNIKKHKLKAKQQIINGKVNWIIQHEDLMSFIAHRDGVQS